MLKFINRTIKLIISLLVFIFDSISGYLQSLLNHGKATCVILYYHAVYTEEKETFARQMDDLLRWTKPIALNEIDVLKTSGRYCAVTFDDGFVCVQENALPVLAKRKIPATIFVPSACLGQRPPWLDETHKDYQNVIMTQAQLNHLDKKLIVIGSHGRKHLNLLRISPDEARKEIVQSKKELKDILNRPIDTISFPEGDFNQTHINMAIQAGYRQAYSIEPEQISPRTNPFLRGRVKVDPSDWRIEYWMKLSGAYRWLPLAFVLKRKIRTCFN